MAIGARILSNNLSGQTATVTFFPTSGGTIDLGSQTIPFNNITSDPYGVYEIYVPLYDYTYELTISQAVNGVQSFVFISKMISNNNNASAILNFNDFTAEILDLNIDYSGWYMNDLYPLTNSGYAYYFENDNAGSNFWWVVFADSAGNVIGDYQAYTDGDYDYNDTAGKYVYFLDYYNGITKYFDGQEVYTITVDPSYQYFEFNTGWDGVTSNNNLIGEIYNYTANTVTTYIISSGDTLTQIGSTFNTNDYNWEINTYFSGNFIPYWKYNQGTNEFDSFDVYSEDGMLLQSYNLSGLSYTNNYYAFYGDNKFVISFWNNGDINIEYLFLHYDGNTDVLNSTTHARGVNYEYLTLNSQTNFFPNNGGSESFIYTLAQNNGSNDVGTVVNYCDFIYMLSGDTDFRTVIFQNSGTGNKTVNEYFSVSNDLNTLCDRGDGLVSVLSLTQTGITYNSTNIPMSGNPNYWNSYTVGNGTVFVILDDNNHIQTTLCYVKENGSMFDIDGGLTLTGAYQLKTDGIGDIFQWLNYSGDSYHIDSTSDLFQQGGGITGNTLYTYYPQAQFKSDFLNTGPILTLNYTTRKCNLLTSTGYTSNFVLPENNGSYDIKIGSSKFMYTFLDMSGNCNINLYDFNFNLLNSVVTEYTNFSYTNVCGERFVTTINANNQYINYLVSESTITSVALTNDNSYYSINDYIWWD